MTREQLDAFCKAVAAVCKEHNTQIAAQYGYPLAIRHIEEREVWHVDKIDPEGYQL
jgi:hypothetical protein